MTDEDARTRRLAGRIEVLEFLIETIWANGLAGKSDGAAEETLRSMISDFAKQPGTSPEGVQRMRAFANIVLAMSRNDDEEPT